MSNSVPKDEEENGTAKLIKGTATPAEEREEERKQGKNDLCTSYVFTFVYG